MGENISLTRCFFDALETHPARTGDVHRHVLAASTASGALTRPATRATPCTHVMRHWQQTYRVPDGWLKTHVSWAYCPATRTLFHTEATLEFRPEFKSMRDTWPIRRQ